MPGRRSPLRRAARRGAAPALAVVAALLLGACSGSDAPTPAEQRLTRVETRLGSSFSDRQVDCILDQLGPAELAALDRKAALPADDDALGSYTQAVRTCVLEGGSTTTTAATTTVPAGSGSTTTTGPSGG